MKINLRLTAYSIGCIIIKNENRYHYRNINLMYICICKGIKESDVRNLGKAGVTCPKELACVLELDDKKNCCGRCMKNISKFVELASAQSTEKRSSLVS